MVLWPQSHIIHQLAAALRQAMESSKPADYVAFEIIKEAWRLMDGQDPKTADWHFAASAYINAYHDTAPAQHVIPDEITPDEDNSYDYVEGWNACRSEMLKAQQNEPQNIPENIPAKPIGEHKWISVDERMPDNYAPVLVCSNRGIIWCAEVEDGDFYPDEFPNLPREGFEITHWMPLPAAPAQENE